MPNCTGKAVDKFLSKIHKKVPTFKLLAIGHVFLNNRPLSQFTDELAHCTEECNSQCLQPVAVANSQRKKF